ncbi:YfcE family phosphodiesterase [Halosegnis rubeus]|jgi:putative phosphoesterase|uniref:Phosphoesterase n=1 Tax=Halosegnis rubeus TaxID=2212850 RepID=A0A5N5UGM2_9EURY|nr:metallophosphoesterase family protein [Halosegnis rubeus]KAB7512567.1 YfcE family phosphodiesterase [Halosegnis rubeus]KAB7514502.1 YfcE family phosphodiesterase [Halosegnis rubeus]KAB7517808.1 YfcE family phosphodiesterase [Halosegnis rubeus]
MEIAVVSDTHIPTRETEIPGPFRERIAAADHTVHAGDFETRAVLDDLRDLATDLTAVYGNIDPADIGLPAVADFRAEGVHLVVSHGTLNPVEAAVHQTDATTIGSGSEVYRAAIADTARVRARAWTSEDTVVGIGGHIHEVVDEEFEGIRVLNPGSVTGADPAERPTMLTLTLDSGDVDVTLHEL